MSSRWSGIFAGSVVCICLKMMLILFGAGIGLFAFPFERVGEDWKWIGMGVGSGIYLGVCLAIASYIGGYIASRLHLPQQKGEACFQGLATWGTASIVSILLGYSLFSTSISLSQKGAGAMVALEWLSKTNPRVITDFSIMKGKAVTSIDLGLSPDKLVKIAKKEAASEDAKVMAETARKTLAASCLGLFFGMLVSAVSSALGAWGGRPRQN